MLIVETPVLASFTDAKTFCDSSKSSDSKWKATNAKVESFVFAEQIFKLSNDDLDGNANLYKSLIEKNM
uniref:Uncharacterized protein n=1 Tax=Romanomermis culicivorax TaxID=13658 RepID=A0A915L467_ROMCU